MATASAIAKLQDHISGFSQSPYAFVKDQFRKRKAAKLLESVQLTESIKREELFTSTYSCRQAETRWTELSCGGSLQLCKYNQPKTDSEASIAEESKEDSESILRNIDSHLLICTAFWKSSLTLSNYKYGHQNIDFGSLWSSEDRLCAIMRDACHMTELQLGITDLLLMCLRVGPLRMLKVLLEENIVDKNARLAGGRSLLHIACIHGNLDAVLYLSSMDVDTKVQDQQGNTPKDVCSSDGIKNLLPVSPHKPLRQTFKFVSKSWTLSERERDKEDPSVSKKVLTAEAKNKIFDLFHDMNNWEDVTCLLKDYEFLIDEDKDDNGDLLVHIAARKGLSYVAALLGLKYQMGAEFDITNDEGCTPLVLVVCNDDDVMADFLISVIGVDINFPHPDSGWTALHHAAHIDSLNLVSLLVKRGANLNTEATDGTRAEAISHSLHSDSSSFLKRAQESRMKQLADSVSKGCLGDKEFYDEDLFEVDDFGDTLIMTAARNNQPEQLNTLLRRKCAPIDAQNYKTGQTALSIAAAEGHAEIIHILLKNGAAAGIADMVGLTPLHHAVITKNEASLNVLLEYPRVWVGLQKAYRLAKTRRMKLILSRTIVRRQTNLVMPALFEAAMSGSIQTLIQLLEEGDNINPSSCTHDWPLYVAAGNGHLKVVEFLYENGGDISCCHPTSGNTALHMAAVANHGAVVKFILNEFTQAGRLAARVIANRRNEDGKTALQLAADNGYIRIVEQLLAGGASPAALDSTGHLYQCRGYQGIQMLLDEARKEHAQQIFTAIYSKNAIDQLVNVFVSEFDHNLRHENGDTPLMVAAFLGKQDTLDFLLHSATQKPPSQAKCPQFREQAMTMERISGSNQSLKTIDSSDQSESRIYEDFGCFSPGEESPLEEDFGMNLVEKRRSYSHDPDSSQTEGDSEGYHTFDDYPAGSPVSGSKRNSECCSDTYETIPHSNHHRHSRTIAPNWVCSRNLWDARTALHRAVEGGDRPSVVKALLSADSGILNLQDEGGLTGLHLACKLRRRKVTELLLTQTGIDINLRTLDGSLPEELTRNKAIRCMVRKSRQQDTSTQAVKGENKIKKHSLKAESTVESVLSFDGLNNQFVVLKERWLSKQRQQHFHRHGSRNSVLTM